MPNRDYHQKEEINIDILEMLRDIIRDIWLIILIGISSAMCTYIIANMVYKPEYTTKATFVVTTKGYNDIYSNLSATISVAETLTNIFASDVLANKVAADMGVASVGGHIQAKVVDETNLLEIWVTSNSPNMAYKIINSVISNYTLVTNNVFNNAIIDVLEQPSLPIRPSNSLQPIKIMIIAFGIGMVAMALVLGLLSVTRDNIKNEGDMVRKLDARLFGVVYHEKKYKTLRSRIFKKKKSILINSPTVSMTFVESIKKMRAKFEYKVSQSGNNVLLVTSVLENEGKSTIATNLALALAQKSMNVLLIDADFSKPSIYKILQKNMEDNKEIGDCVINKSDIKEALSFDERNGLYLLIGSKLYDNSTDIVARESFKKLIQVSKNIMDYVIIDAPPMAVSADTEILADMADASLLIVRQSTARTRSINDAIEILNNSNSELLGCVFNNVYTSELGHHVGYGYKYGYKASYEEYDMNATVEGN